MRRQDLPVGCYPDPQLADFAGVYEHGEYLSVLVATKASVGKLAEVPSFSGEPEEEVDEGERMLVSLEVSHLWLEN